MINKLKNKQKISIDIWGQKTKVELYSVRIDYDKPKDDTFNDDEMSLLNYVIENHLIENEEIKKSVLDYINKVYNNIGMPRVKTILSPEVVITTLVVNDLNKVVAFCGECKCDEEEGISISFYDGKFAGVGQYMDYEFAKKNYHE